jgi:signal transduction histidine kinase
MPEQAGPVAAPREQAPTVGGRYERIKAAEAARQALMTRPRLSFRMQIYLGFLLAFIFAFGIATSLVTTIYLVENKMRFLEIASEYVTEIQQARRFEKNYFLYGTNLQDALEQVYLAKTILEKNSEELIRVAGDKRDKIIPHLLRYEELLKGLAALEREPDGDQLRQKRKAIEMEVRRHGQEMVSFAQDVMSKEKESMARMVARSRDIHILSFAVASIFMLYIAYFLGSTLLGTVNRFQGYAQRIAAGDFTPITPVRRFRDEFTDLAVTINQMLQELEAHEGVLVQTHKMRAVGTLTAGVAHELNNPLNNITLTAHALLEDYRELPDQERQEMLGDLVTEAGRAQRIIKNLLDFVRESGAQMEPLDLVALLKDTIHLAANQVKLSGIKIEFSATDNLPRVHGDAQQLQQVFLNLILNAMDASPKGGKIQALVVPADEPNFVAVKIIDFGSGIGEHILGSIFDPFFTTKTKGKGTGLGLSVSQGIVAKHGGRIVVSSREGQGSTFSVVLPVTTLPARLGDDRLAAGRSES